ncbi:hypothetical protein EIP91_005350 [Steccherinum ochraceum]|uniref:DNA repair protein RAD51 homolog 3 n=1 Tax=Steccherinum ochraceum TaxID=92696 RepID=A0A4R0R7A5_9APHY|nr:hypothetical protein EIP91_005350 [Steccherinum ochraceum]
MQGNRPVTSLGLDPDILRRLVRAKLETVADITAASEETLSKELGISPDLTQKIYMATQTQRAHGLTQTQTAAVMVGANSKKYSSFCRPLDAILDGGIRRGSIIEVSGPPGSPKEHIAANITLSFLEEKEEILFVDMQNMTTAETLKSSLRKATALPPNHEKHVHYLSIHTLVDLMVFLNQLSTYLQSHKTSLLVLNSLSFPFQTSAGLPHSTRHALLERTKMSLAKACASSDLTVIITTQLATKLLNADGSSANFDTGSRAVLLPQLGMFPLHMTIRSFISPFF